MNSEEYTENLFNFIYKTAVIKFVASLIWQLPLLIIFYYISIAFLCESVDIKNMFHILNFQSLAYFLCSIVFYSIGSFMNLHISYMYRFKGNRIHYKKNILTLVSRLLSMIFFNFSLISYSKNFQLSMLIFVDAHNLLCITIPIVIVGSLINTVKFITYKEYLINFPSFLDSRYTKRIFNQIPHIIQNTFVTALIPTLLCLLFIKFNFYKYYTLYINFFVLYSFWNILLEYMKIVLTSISLLKTIDEEIRQDNKLNDINIIIDSLFHPVGINIIDNMNINSNNNNRFNILSDPNERFNTIWKDYFNIINNNYKNTVKQLKENNETNKILDHYRNYEKYEFAQSYLYKYISFILLNDSSNINQIINSKIWYKLCEVLLNNINSFSTTLEICNEISQLKTTEIPDYIFKLPFGLSIWKIFSNHINIMDKKLDIITGNIKCKKKDKNEWFLYPNSKNEVVLSYYNNTEEIINILIKLIQQNSDDVNGYVQITIPALLESLTTLQMELEKYIKENEYINNEELKKLSLLKEKEFENVSYCVDLLICEIVSKYYNVLSQFSFSSSSCNERINEYKQKSRRMIN